jgi:glycosyltransferase involved in cell wall biosynthesis
METVEPVSAHRESSAGQRLRIAVYAETFPPDSGGVAAAHYSLANVLRQRHDVRLFAFEDARPSTDDIKRASGNGAQGRILATAAAAFVMRHDRDGSSALSRRIAAVAAAVRKLNADLRSFNPDVIIVPDFCAPSLALNKPAGAATLWVAHHNYKRFEKYPLVRTGGWYDNFFAHRLEKRALKKCDYAVFPSRYMEGVFRETLDPSLPGSVIHNTVDLSHIRAVKRERVRGDLGLRPESLLVYLPSGGTTAKGARYAFEIVRRLSDNDCVRFFISGPVDPQLKSELAPLVAAGTVIAPGKLAHEKNLEMVAASDIVVSPALVENFSCALLEAQGAGLPCVTFDTGGNAELVVDGETGFVVPYLDVEGLVRESARLLTDAALRQKMSEAAKLQADRICDDRLILDQYETAIAAARNSSAGRE